MLPLKRLLFFLCGYLAFFSPPAFAQDCSLGSCAFVGNLVPNADFELYDFCPPGYSNLAACSGWTPGGDGSSDYMNGCADPVSQVDVPTNIFGSELAASGIGYSGFYTYVDFGGGPGNNYREYLRTQLSEPLEVGETYLVQMQVTLADNSFFATENLGVYFSTDAPYISVPGTVAAQVQFEQYVDSSTGWTTVCAIFVADQAYEWIVIGNLDDDTGTTFNQVSTNNIEGLNTAYYFVDDVVIAPLDATSQPVATPQAVATEVCQGGSIQLLGLPNIDGASYTWIGPNGYISGLQNPVINNATAAQGGEYLLIVTADCDSEPTPIQITVSPTASTTVQASICAGETYFAGGANQSQAGVYTDTSIDANGCQITQTTILSITPAYQATQNLSICEGESVFVGGASQTQAGTYTDVFTTALGCDSTVVTQLAVRQAPQQPILNGALICAGSSTPLDATISGEVTYAWSNGQTSPIINATNAGTYTVTVSNSCGQRTAEAQIDTIAAPMVQLGEAAQSFCIEQNNVLDATNAGATYAWSTGSNEPQITVAATGVYAVTVTNECGTTTDQVCATVQSCDPACASLELLHSYICDNNGFTYQIYGGAQGGAAPYDVSGSYNGNLMVDNELFVSDHLPNDLPYQLNLVDANGCLRSVLECQPICSILPIELLRLSGEATPSGNYLTWITASEINNSYFTLWRSTDGTQWKKLTDLASQGNNTFNQYYHYLDTNPPANGWAYYQLTQTDIDGTTTQAGKVSLLRDKQSLHIGSLYPMPVSDVLHLNLTTADSTPLQLHLYNALGQLLLTQTVTPTSGTPNTQHTLDMAHLPSGVYALVLTNGSDTAVQKVVKQ